MSTKTIKQRIALVAVSALTAGVLSVVSAPASNAAVAGATTPALNLAATSTSVNPQITHYDRLQIATIPTGTGSGIALTAAAGGLATPDTGGTTAPATATARSLGLVNVSDIAGGLSAGTTQTAVLLSTGRLSVYTSTQAAEYSAITVTGGTFSSSTGTSMNATSTLVSHGGAGATVFGVVAAPSSGATTMTIKLYTGNSTIAAANAALGDLEGQITVSIVAASTAGAVSPTYSGLFGATYANSEVSLTADSGTYLGGAAYNNDMWLNVRVKDAYNTAITAASAGILQVSATNGALVNFGASAGATVSTDGTTTTAYASTTTPDNWAIQVSNPDLAPRITTVTVSWNGTVIGSKTMQFFGEVAKITLSSPVIGKLSGSANNAYYRMYDSAGAAVYSTQATVAQTAYTAAGVLNDPSVNGTGTASALTKVTTLSIDAAGTVTSGKVQFTCGATAGNGTVGLTYTNASGTIVKSNALAVKCAGAPLTYSAAWDKASYTPGDLAKLVVTFKDSKGNLANGVDAVANTNLQDTPSFSIGGLDKTISGPTSADTIEDGVLTYTYTVGASEGAFTGKLTFPVVDARQVAAGATSAAAVPVTLTVKSASTAVTNADVLKSIVALIASINKQIQALQALILKKK